MQLYSIMPLDVEHIDEICEDIKLQYQNGVSDCVLFMMQLVPEGNPAIDKAAIETQKYDLFRDKLADMGLQCGILVQCSLGHGYPLNQKFSFQSYVNLNDGKEDNVCCPYDEAFQQHFYQQMRILAMHKPAVIMLDDDFRLMYRNGKGCACPLHLKEVSKRANKNITREYLYETLRDIRHEDNKVLTDIFVETQKESLIDAVTWMRKGIDSVDPAIPGCFCSVGHTTEFGADIAKIMAGEGNPVVVRINNGNYTPLGARGLSEVSYRIAQQSEVLKGKVDYVLAETDTCPQNRYSTGAQSLHSHFVASILEGAVGAKHWITRLSTYEPKSGIAYRKILAKHRKLYEKLFETVPGLRWQGCRIPLPTVLDYGFTHDGWYAPTDAWSACVLERFGVPLYFSSQQGGTTFVEGDSADSFSDAEIEQMLQGCVVLSSDAAEKWQNRGFGGLLGVTVQVWTGENPSYEKFLNGKTCAVPQKIQQLIPLSQEVKVNSQICHLVNGKDEKILFPGVTVYNNKFGGRVIVFSGTPKAKFVQTEAFSFLNESRKEQIVSLLQENGTLPIYYTEDAEVYMKAAFTEGGKLFCAIFNMGFDTLRDVPLRVMKPVKNILRLTANGEYVACRFKQKDGICVVKTVVNTLDPKIFLFEWDEK